MITEEEMQRRIAEAQQQARQQQMLSDLGKTWFTEALSHTAGMVKRGEFLPEAHQMGIFLYQTFLQPAQAPVQTPEAKPAEKPE